MKAVVWSKHHCPFCDQAKALLTQKGIEFEEKNSRWGTMFLDNTGKPMSCNKKITVEQYSL